MKKLFLLLLCACLMLPASALGDRLTQAVSEYLACDAEIPADIPQSLPIFMATPVSIDPEKAIELLIPGKGPREDLTNGDVIVGDGDGEHDYMLIEKDNGRICYNSEYVNLYLLELMPDRGSVTKGYLPTDLSLDFMTPQESVQMAAELMKQLGIEVTTDDAVVYTLEQASFADMQQIMRESDWLSHITRKRALRYLEPLSKEHEGYCVNLTPTINGYPYMVRGDRWEVCVLITRQGIEYVETGFNLRLTEIGDDKPLISPKEALKTIAEESDRINRVEGLCTIERITLAYRFDTEKQTMTPCWIFDYCSDGAGGMQNYTFDHWVSMYGVGVDGYSGKVMDQKIY